ncbi:uncharacterized protein TNCV_5021571 [Trichonephila clavipes]|nr:uncharacterized protein TNCV_5021571 [Trichonephila clavipes]
MRIRPVISYPRLIKYPLQDGAIFYETLARDEVNAINQIELRSELRDRSDNNNAANKTYESRILKRESRSDESEEEKHGTISNEKKNLDNSLPSKSLESIHFIVLAVTNSWFQCKQDAISNKIPPKIKTDHLKFKLEVVEALAASPSANKSISTDENNSVVRERFHSQKDQSVMIHMLEISCLLSWPFQKKKALPV